MRNIANDIKQNSYKTIYLLYGDESYLKTQYKNNLINAICGDDTMNYSYFEGKGFDIKEFIGIAETMPFFADRRIIVAENTGVFKSANDELVEYIKNIPESTVVVFVESDVDKRNRMFKTTKDVGYICEMTKQTPEMLKKWIAGILAKDNKKISESTANVFLERVGSDMENIHNEIVKLIFFVGEREVIEVSDIDEITVTQINVKVFDMVDALGYKNLTKALTIYYELIANKEAPAMILYMLSRQFNIMLKVMEMKKLGADNKKIAEKTGLAPFVVTKTLKQLENFNYKTIKGALQESVDLEEQIKSGGMNDKMAIEMLLIKYSSR